MELGLTQEALAERIGEGVRQADVSRLENDRIMLPRRDRLERLAEALDVPLGVLLARSGWAGADEGMAAALIAATPVTALSLPGVAADQVPAAVEILNQVKVLVEQVEAMIDVPAEPATVTAGDETLEQVPADYVAGDSRS